MKVQREQSTQVHEESVSDKQIGKTLAPPAFSLTASDTGDTGAQGAEEGSGETMEMASARATADSHATGGSDDDPLAELDKLLQRKLFQHSKKIPQLLMDMAPAQKALIRANSGYRHEICEALRKDREGMRKTMIAIDASLADKVLWMNKWAMLSQPGTYPPYSDISKYIKSASQEERDALKTAEFKKLFKQTETDEGGRISMLNDLNFDLATKLDWYRYFEGNAIRYSKFREWIVADPAGANAAAQSPELKAWLIDVCLPSDLIDLTGLMGLSVEPTFAWLLEKETKKKFELSYPELVSLLQREPAAIRQVLQGEARWFLLRQTTLQEALQLVTDIHLDLLTAVIFLSKSYEFEGKPVTLPIFRSWIKSAPVEQRQALKDPAAKEIILPLCDQNTIVPFLDELQFDLKTKLDWLKGMQYQLAAVVNGPQLDYASVRPLVSGAEGDDKDYLKTVEGQDQVLGLGGKESIGDAIQDLDLKLPLKDKIERLYQSVGIYAVEAILDNTAAAERDKIWRDKKLMAKFQALMGDNDYLTLICSLRMRYASKAVISDAVKVDEAIQKHLGAYVKVAVERGFTVAGHVAIVDAYHWEIAGKLEFGEKAWNDKWRTECAGFVDDEKRAFVNKDTAGAAAIIHESVHRYSNLGPDGIIYKSQPLNEGVTEYFTRKVCKGVGLNPAESGVYNPNFDFVVKLNSFIGEATLAKAFFEGPATLIEEAFIRKKGAKLGTELWEKLLDLSSKDSWNDTMKLL